MRRSSRDVKNLSSFPTPEQILVNPLRIFPSSESRSWVLKKVQNARQQSHDLKNLIVIKPLHLKKLLVSIINYHKIIYIWYRKHRWIRCTILLKISARTSGRHAINLHKVLKNLQSCTESKLITLHETSNIKVRIDHCFSKFVGS